MAGSFLRLFRQSFVIRLIIGFCFAAITLAVIGYLITGPCEQRVAAFDEGVRVAARSLASPVLTSLLKVVTKSGSTLVLTIVGTGAVFVFLWLSWKREVVLLLVGMVGQIFLHEGFKFLIECARVRLFRSSTSSMTATVSRVGMPLRLLVFMEYWQCALLIG